MLLIALAIAGAPVPAPTSAYLPDHSVTPGALNPAVTLSTLHSTVCVHGWTKTIRPPASYTTKLKITQMRAFGLPGPPSLYEEDHLVSLEIGGNPTDPANLWPEPWNGQWGAHKKDRLENLLKKLVCNGTVTLGEAQHAIATDWVATYKLRVGK